MFKKFFETGAYKDVSEPDILSLNDPIAEKVDWSSNSFYKDFESKYNLVYKNPKRLEFHLNSKCRLIQFLFLFIGGGVITLFILINSILNLRVNCCNGDFLVGGFLLLSIWLFWSLMTKSPIIFDKSEGCFKKEKSKLFNILTFNFFSDALCELKDIHALQLVSREVRVNYEHEVNIILNDSRRIHIINDYSLEKIKKDAKELSIFLNIPVWDATKK